MARRPTEVARREIWSPAMLFHYRIRPWDLALYRGSEVKRIQADMEIREQAFAAQLHAMGIEVDGGDQAPRKRATGQDVRAWFARNLGGV